MSDNPGCTADFIKSDTDQATFMKAGFSMREAKKGAKKWRDRSA